jgi:hypothetical protein
VKLFKKFHVDSSLTTAEFSVFMHRLSELAEKIAEFIHAFPNLDQSLMFLNTFYATMGREWAGIDKLRLNKFYYLVRCFLRESFVFLARQKWNPDAVGALNKVLLAGPLFPDSKCTDLKLHLADIFLDELRNSGTFESGFGASTLLTLVEPFFELLIKSSDRSVFERGYSRVLQSLISNRWLAASLNEADDVDPLQLNPIRHSNRMFRHTYIEPVPLYDVCGLCLDPKFASEAMYAF